MDELVAVGQHCHSPTASLHIYLNRVSDMFYFGCSHAIFDSLNIPNHDLHMKLTAEKLFHVLTMGASY